jgi:radical SAM-linked protein
MALDASPAAKPSPPVRTADPVRDKVRLRFRKGGDLRLVSHHDLMQCFERMLRRAALPFHSTQGFNPKPRMAFALSLALGIVGCEEVVELELDGAVPPEEIRERLADVAPPGLDILSARRIDRRTRAQARRVAYRLAVPGGRVAGLAERMTALLSQAECCIERTRPQPRRLDIRPYLCDLCLHEGALEMTFWVTPHGTARPEEVVALLGLADLLEAGVVLERVTLELYDEADQTVAEPRPVERPGPTVPAEGPSRPRPMALVPGPLSFDT